MSQLSYNINQPRAFAGMKVDAGFDRVESFAVEDVAGMRFGIFAAKGTDPEQQVQIPTTGDDIRGSVIHRHVPKAVGTGEAKLEQTDPADIMKQGLTWMRISGTAPAVEAPVYAMIDTAADAGFATGLAGTNNILVPTAVCRAVDVDPDGDAICAVELNIP